MLDLGVKNILLSFYYWRTALRSKGGGKALSQLARMRKAQAKGYSFMLDSGAFTYQTNAAKGVPLPDVHEYFNDYLDFVKEHYPFFDSIVEFDVDRSVVDSRTGAQVTTAQANTWIERMLDVPGLAQRVMPICHSYRGLQWRKDWMENVRSPFTGNASGDIVGLGAVIAQAHRYGKHIHGFGQTRIKTDMRTLNFDSVDSTTWLRADRFGGTMIFRNGQMTILDHLHKADRRLYHDWYTSWGLDFKRIISDDLYENRKATIISWREMSNYMERQAAMRSGGVLKRPYLLDAYLKGKPIPVVHPLEQYLKDHPEE